MVLQINVKRVGVVLLCSWIAGCSWIDSTFPERKKIDYKASKTGSTLEVPPDLTRPDQDDSMIVPDIAPSGSASYSQYAEERSGSRAGTVSRVMPQQENIRFVREGQRHWLVLQGEPDQVWGKVRAFWQESGFLLTIDDPAVGILETDWSENRADIPTGPVRKLLSKVLDSLYSAATRDKFRVRVERGLEPNTTELFLTHRGMEEEVQGSSQDTSTGTIWIPRERDPELEIELLKRMLVFVGTEDKKAERILATKQTQQAPRSSLVTTQGGEVSLLVSETYDRTWRYVGLALDQVGFNVEDRDRSHGTYYVRYRDPEKESGKEKGFFSKLAFWSGDEKVSEDQYQVHLQSEVDDTRITVLDQAGKPDDSATARRILTLLQEQLK